MPTIALILLLFYFFDYIYFCLFCSHSLRSLSSVHRSNLRSLLFIVYLTSARRDSLVSLYYISISSCISAFTMYISSFLVSGTVTPMALSPKGGECHVTIPLYVTTSHYSRHIKNIPEHQHTTIFPLTFIVEFCCLFCFGFELGFGEGIGLFIKISLGF